MKTNSPIPYLTNWKTIMPLLTIGAAALILTTAAGKPPSGPSDIPLRVTIENFGAMASDGLGEYRNGEKGVEAVFTADQGRFSFDTGRRRTAYIDLGVGLEPGNHQIHLLVSRDHQDPNVNDPELADPTWHNLFLDQLPIGESTPVGLLVFIRTKHEGDWIVGIGDYPQATEVNHWPCGAATAAIITRVDATTWTFESDTTADHCLYWGFANQGQIAFPFKMTLRLK